MRIVFHSAIDISNLHTVRVYCTEKGKLGIQNTVFSTWKCTEIKELETYAIQIYY